MPNWCNNALTITGSGEILKEIREKVATKDTDFSFERVLPQGDWGTKWDADGVDMEESEGELYYGFSTAWGPPLPVIEELSRLFPSATFDIVFEEMGSEVNGHYVYKDGDSVTEEDLSNADYKERYDDDFKGLIEQLDAAEGSLGAVEFLKKGDWEDWNHEIERYALKRVSDNDLMALADYEWDDYEAEESFVERVKQKDLPLLINNKWSSGGRSILERRMKELKIK